MKSVTTMSAGIFSVFFAVGAIFIFGFFQMPTAHAAECGITAADIGQIATVQSDPSLSIADEATAELALRKQLVSSTIVCAEQEVDTLQSQLASTSVKTADQSLQAQFLGKLGIATDFYTGELVTLSSTQSSADTENIAGQILNWRQTTFVPLSGQVNNFIFWSDDQALFDTAQTRMENTQTAVALLLNTTPNSSLQDAMNAAMTSFADAQNDNNAARAAIAQGVPPDESIALIKESLDWLSTTYQNFFNVSAIINNILPR